MNELNTLKLKVQIAKKASMATRFLDSLRPKPVLTHSQIEKALFFARLADCAYPSRVAPDKIIDPIVRFQELLGDVPVKGYLSNVGAAAYVITFPTYRAIVFRGTELDLSDISKLDLRDVKSDLNFQPVLFGSGFAHGGGLEQAKSLYQIIEYLRVDPTLPLVIAGHSLACILGAIFAFLIKTTTTLNISSVWSFCPPRTFDDVMRQEYNRILGDKTFSIVHGFDVVPRFSPPKIMPKLSVPGTIVFLPFGGDDIPVAFNLFNRAMSLYKGVKAHGIGFKKTVRHLGEYHYITGIIARLEGMVKRIRLSAAVL